MSIHMSSINKSVDNFHVIYNDINVILRLVNTKENVSRFVEVMRELAILWSGYKKRQEMEQKNIQLFFQAIIQVVTELNNRIHVTQLKLINNDQERVTYMINFLHGLLADIKKYSHAVSMYAYVLDLLQKYNPPALSLLPTVREPTLPMLHEDAEEEEEAFDATDGVRSVPGEDITQDGHAQKMHVNGGISSLLCRMKELSLE